MYCFKAKRNALSSQLFLSSNLTVGSSVSVQAGAFVSAVAVVARAAVLAGFGIALVDVVLAVVARESRRAQAREGVDAIHARAAIEAGAAGRKCWRSLRVRKGCVKCTCMKAFLILEKVGPFVGVQILQEKRKKLAFCLDNRTL